MPRLDKQAAAWVESSLSSMSLQEAVGHLVMPEDRNYKASDWLDILKKAPLGCVFVSEKDKARTEECLAAIQERSKVPVIAAADMEQGLGDVPGYQFPYSMALGATGSETMTEEKGFITGRQARAMGIHWLFQPVIDLNIDPMNPETNIRAFGDCDHIVKKLSVAQIKGLQKGGVAATAKHFPGAGMDDRDQHLCTSLNPLPMDVWMDSYGKVWKAAIKAGVMSVMPGHIALPDFEGLLENAEKAMPATLNKKLLQILLRKELGFEGVIVSDAAPMIGVTSRCKGEDIAVEFIRAGGDVFLFAEPVDDYKRILAAVKSGRISERRVWESVKRILTMKAQLGLHKSVKGEALSKVEKVRAMKLPNEIAEASATIVKSPKSFPVKLKKGSKVLTATIKWPGAPEFRCPELKVVDSELKRLGYKVDHILNPSHTELGDAVSKYDCIFVNVIQIPHALIGNIRMIGPMIMPFWRAFYAGADNCVFTSFGSPYLLYEQPHWPNFLVMYSPSEASQRAAVGVWTGRIKAKGQLPFHHHG